MLALALAAIGLFALVTTWAFSREWNADQVTDETWETVVWFLPALAGSGSAFWAVREALLTLTKTRDPRHYTSSIAAAALSYAAWLAFAYYLS